MERMMIWRRGPWNYGLDYYNSPLEYAGYRSNVKDDRQGVRHAWRALQFASEELREQEAVGCQTSVKHGCGPDKATPDGCVIGWACRRSDNTRGSTSMEDAVRIVAEDGIRMLP